ERNQIEKQALSAIMNVAHVILFIIDPSEHCGYPMEVQLHLLEEVKAMVTVPVLVVANKSDLIAADGYTMMSTADGTGVDDVLAELLTYKPIPAKRVPTLRGPDPEAKAPAPEEVIIVEYAAPAEEDTGARRARPKRARKPRTR